MKKKCSYHIEPLDINYIKENLDIIPREFLNLFEYRRFSTNELRQNFLARLDKFESNKRNFSISLIDNSTLFAYMLFEYLPFDSEIFEFNVYGISDFCFLGKDYSENEYIIQCLLAELNNKIDAYNIKYLTISLNVNIPVSNLFFNSLMRNSFYYIHTLITYKIEEEEFKRINLYKIKNSDIKIRLADKKDIDSLMVIASKFNKIDRFHLDRNLNKEKCDSLYARSVKNSILHGYADVIFVAEYKNEVVGYCSGKKKFNPFLNTAFGDAIIVAVADKARGLGIFSLMNSKLLKWFYDNTDIAELGTYLTNIPVHKTFAKNGLNIIRGSYQLARFRE